MELHSGTMQATTLSAALSGPSISFRRHPRSNRPNVTAMAGHGRFFVGGALPISIDDKMAFTRATRLREPEGSPCLDHMP